MGEAPCPVHASATLSPCATRASPSTADTFRHVRRFLDRHAAKRAQFDDLRKSAVDGFQTTEGVVEREHGYVVPARRLMASSIGTR